MPANLGSEDMTKLQAKGVSCGFKVIKDKGGRELSILLLKTEELGILAVELPANMKVIPSGLPFYVEGKAKRGKKFIFIEKERLIWIRPAQKQAAGE